MYRHEELEDKTPKTGTPKPKKKNRKKKQGRKEQKHKPHPDANTNEHKIALWGVNGGESET